MSALSDGSVTNRSAKSFRKDKSTRKGNKIERSIIWNVIEEMIDEFTEVEAYTNYIRCNMKRDN